MGCGTSSQYDARPVEDERKSRAVNEPSKISSVAQNEWLQAASETDKPTEKKDTVGETGRNLIEVKNLVTPNKASDSHSEAQPLGLHISAVRRFLAEHPNVELEGMTTSQVKRNGVSSETLGTNRPYIDKYVGHTNANGTPLVAPATVFVSHAWKYEFSGVVVDVMEQHCKGDPDAYFWFDLFTNDQNAVSSKDFNWFSSTFRGSIQRIGQVLLVLSPWNDPIPIQRAWCLFEIHNALSEESIKFSIGLPTQEISSMSAAIVKNKDSLIQALSDIQAEKATATCLNDRDMIFGVIRKSEGGFYRVNEEVKDGLREWYVDKLRQLVFEKREDHELLLACAEVTHSFGFYDEALRYCMRCVEHARGQTIATEYTVRSLNTLASVYFAKRELDRAIEHASEALQTGLRVLGENHSEVAKAYTTIGIAAKTKATSTENKELLDEALDHHNKALSIRLSITGENHCDVADSYNNIGNIYSRKMLKDEALDYYWKSLNIRKATLGENHPKVAVCLNNIAGVYRYKDKLDVALEYYEQSMNIKHAAVGEMHPLTAMAYHNLASTYMEKGEFEKALESANKSLAIRVHVFGKSHPTVIDCYANIALIYSSQSKTAQSHEEVFEYQKKAAQIVRYMEALSNNETQTHNKNKGAAVMVDMR